MDETVLKIALAGLLHDIGKFAQGCMEISNEYRSNNESIYQPLWDGRYSHQHGLYTAAFIEKYSQALPSELLSRQWGQGDAFINLAACHHKPESPLQWIITIADHISSGLDRATFEKGEAIAWQDFKTTRLLPVLESLGPERHKAFKHADAFQYRYALAPISASAIFPAKAIQLDKKSAQQEYQALFNKFTEKMSELFHRESNVSLWAQHLDSLLMAFTSLIPAARVGDVVHDVSLYDHSRTTAAFAAALYLYHLQTDTLEERSIRQGDTDKFLLVSGDFYGIQDFIFSNGGETQTHRSKILRGRSFAVSLFSELATDMLCRVMNLSPFSVVLNAAGKFHLIAPNTAESLKSIESVEQQINDWLFSISYGQSSMGITSTSAKPEDFHCSCFTALWEKHLQRMELKKFQKIDLAAHGGVVAKYLDSFDNSLNHSLCPLCGKRPSVKEAENSRFIYRDENGSSCAICRDHVMLGTYLVKGQRLAILKKSAKIDQDKGLHSPIFGYYQLTFTNEPMEEAARKEILLKLWNLNADDLGNIDHKATNRLINGHVPKYQQADNFDKCLAAGNRSEEKTFDLIEQIKEGTPKTFSHIAVRARHWNQDNNICHGTEALGVLKADVDNLGMLFGCGLPDERFTLSRLATMSRQLNNFFSLYLPYLLQTREEFYDVYTVFAGGDDLFLIGPWNRMTDLALFLRERFTEYVCKNPKITFSAGITVHKPNTPINNLAESSEEALQQAKDGGRNRATIFDETITWDELVTLQSNKTTMERWLTDKRVSKSMFYRFNRFVSLAAEEKEVLALESVDMSAMECLKWPAMFRYSIARNIDTKLKNAERDQAIAEVSVMAKWLKEHGGAVRIPLWQILYEIRR
jgi:CRISPR-associated protein Csm1